MKFRVGILAAIALLSIMTPYSEAQGQKKEPKLKVQNAEWDFLDVTKDKPPEMPGITFPGKPAQFMSGFFMQKDGSRGARFRVPESADAVLAYYSGALNGGGWSCTKPDQQNPRSISATNMSLRATCTISVTTHKDKPGCDVYFVYGTHR